MVQASNTAPERAPDSIVGTVKRTADSLILWVNDIVNRNIFHEMVGKSLCSPKLYIITEANTQPHDSLLSQPLKLVPTTRKLGRKWNRRKVSKNH